MLVLVKQLENCLIRGSGKRYYASLAQLVEHEICNFEVVSSNLTGSSIYKGA